MEAIKDCGGRLIAATDPHDSVGILDKWFPECRYFKEFERFDRYCSRENLNRDPIDYVSVCSPNYLHDAHCRFALRLGADAICEKPLVLKERNLDELRAMEEATGKRVWNILQLRLNKQLQEIREGLDDDHHQVSVQYHTPRGRWYLYSWKADRSLSGGLATNIGVHLFDLLIWMFGEPDYYVKMPGSWETVSGNIEFKKAGAAFELSIKADNDPCRRIVIDDTEIDFTKGFEGLHLKSYQKIMAGRGFGLEDARGAVKLCEAMR